MMEILRSWFTKYRFVPYSELKLDLQCHNPRALEKHIHRVLLSKRFTPHEKVEGHTEMFVELNEVRLLHYLRRFDENNFNSPLDLTPSQYDSLCRLRAP